MLFSTLTFLFVFFPIVFISYYLINPKFKNYLLLVASLVFYAWGEPKYVLVMLGVIVVNYTSGIVIDKWQKNKKTLLAFSIIINLCILGYYKYADFIIENVNRIANLTVDPIHAVLPIGISFYIFQSMSYTIDVYRGIVPVQNNIFKFGLYVSLFPQLVAGPIVKYRDVMEQIDERNVEITDMYEGLRRFIIGLGKKVIIANTMGEVADQIFALSPNEITMTTAWIGAIAYTLQIFFDFSGYSDMAIGIGRIFGFRFLENFNYPYISSTMTEFWRRWHISLSSWFKEYLYIPLGGNRCSAFRNNLNLLIVFFTTGLWHGASWNFVVWGLWHGIFLMLEKKFMLAGGKIKLDQLKVSPFKKLILHVYTILVFVMGWVFFRADNLTLAWEYIKVMFGIITCSRPAFDTLYFLNGKVLWIGSLAIICCYPWTLINMNSSFFRKFTKDIILIVILILSVSYIAAGGYNPFIYFRF